MNSKDGGFGCLLGVLWIVFFPIVLLWKLVEKVK